jgi:hypothetical protein
MRVSPWSHGTEYRFTATLRRGMIGHMGMPRGIVYGIRDLLRWSAAYPNGRLAAAGVAFILIPEILVHGAILLWESFHLPDDLPVHVVTRIQVVQSWWIIVFGMGGVFVAFPIGCVLLLFACWRAWRERRRRAVAICPAPTQDALPGAR